MDLNRLHGFYTVAKSGGFTQAARLLHLTQPTISQQVKNLEAELGVQLLRRARPVALTREGELLLEHAERVFADMDRIHAVFEGLKKTTPAVLNIASNQSTAMHILPEKLDLFTHRFPSVEIAIENLRTGEIIAAVADGPIDVGIILVDPERPGVASRPVRPYEMVLITPRDHPLASRRSITLEDISRYPFISYSKAADTRRLIDAPFRGGRHKLKIHMAMGNTDLIVRYVRLGYGIAIVHGLSLARDRPEDLAVRSLRRFFPVQYLHLIWREGEDLKFPVREFVGLF